MRIVSKHSPLPFIFVSDHWTACNVRHMITRSCRDLWTYRPVPFNSTGDIGLGHVLQYYRGDSAAMVLPGYDNANELPDNPNLGPNPPLPPTADPRAWRCLNTTIGESIPMVGDPAIVWSLTPTHSLIMLVLYFVYLFRRVCRQERSSTLQYELLTASPDPNALPKTVSD